MPSSSSRTHLRVARRVSGRATLWVMAGLAAAWLAGAPGAQAASADAKKPAAAEKPAAPIDPANPAATTATYGDWVVRCSNLPQGEKVCEAATGIQIQVQGQTRLLAQIVVGRAGKDQPVRLIVQLPNGVFLPAGATLYLDEKAKSGFQAVYTVCTQGCFGDAVLDADQLASLKGAKGPGRLEFVEGNRKRVAARISFLGLNAALEAALK